MVWPRLIFRVLELATRQMMFDLQSRRVYTSRSVEVPWCRAYPAAFATGHRPCHDIVQSFTSCRLCHDIIQSFASCRLVRVAWQ